MEKISSYKEKRGVKIVLVLNVHNGDYITIGEDIVVQVLKVGSTFRVAIDAPKERNVVREKVLESYTEAPACIQRLRSLKAQPRPVDKKQFRQAKCKKRAKSAQTPCRIKSG